MYYVSINGENYDRKLMEYADLLVVKKGDGRISKADIELLIKEVDDANKVTDIELKSLHYVRNTYNLTPSAKEVFDTLFTNTNET